MGLRYRHVVRLRRVRVVIICFWFIVASLESIWIWRSGITFLLTLLSEAFSGKNYFLLHKDFLQLRRKESSGPSRTSERRRDSTKHSKIQNKSFSTACMQLKSAEWMEVKVQTKLWLCVEFPGKKKGLKITNSLLTATLRITLQIPTWKL